MSKVWEGAVEAREYHENVMRHKVRREATAEGSGHALPAPYNKRNGTLERDVLRSVKEILQYHGIWHRRLEGIGKVVRKGSEAMLVPGDMAGLPDVLACYRGRLIAIEVKAPGGRLSTAQFRTLRGIHAAGGIPILVCDASRLPAWLKMLTEGYVGGESVACIGGWLEVL